jgi:proteasome beta subunit
MEMDNELKKSILKTGTLTLGLVCKDGIVIAADRRQSYGTPDGGVSYLAGKAKKIIEVNDKIIVTTAGNASDTRKFASILRAELKLGELRSKSEASIKKAANLLSTILYNVIRQPSMIPGIAHFLLAGYDDEGIHLYNAMPDGYLEEIDDYVASGSGIRQAHPILDSEYKKEITTKEGIDLVIKCIRASLGREPGVGDGINVYVVKKGKIEEVLSKEFSTDIKEKSK